MEEEAEQDEDTQEKSLLDQGRLDMLRSLQRPDRPNFLKKNYRSVSADFSGSPAYHS